MPQYIRNHLKAWGLVIGLLGLFAGLGNLLGFFAHTERLEMVRLVRTEASMPSTAPGFSDLLRAYPPPEGVQVAEIASIGLTTHIMSGGYVTPTGPLAYFNSTRQHTRSILTFDELQDWSTATRYPWIAWVFSGIGWLLTAVGVLGDLAQSRFSRDLPNKTMEPTR